MEVTAIFVFIWIFFGIFSIACFAFWIWMLVDCITKVEGENNEKLIWAMVIIFTNWIGALIYFFVQRPKNRQG